MNKAVMLTGVLALQACASANLYEGARQRQQLECARFSGAQYDECMQTASDNYLQYRNKREQVME